MSDIGERVKKIVVEHLGVEADKVVEGASFTMKDGESQHGRERTASHPRLSGFPRQALLG